MQKVSYKSMNFALPDADTMFVREIHRFCGEVEQVLWTTRIPSGGVFVDVGASFGVSTIAAMRSGRFARAIAIEPCRAIHDLLVHNLRINGLSDDRVQVFEAAIVDRDCPYLDFQPPDFTNIGLGMVEPGGSEVVGGRALDSVVEQSGVRLKDVTLVWSDTQGCEGHVLAGASQLLAGSMPWYIEVAPWLLHKMRGEAMLFAAVAKHFGSYTDIRAPKIIHPIGHFAETYAFYRDTIKPGTTDKPWHTNVILWR